MKLYTHEEMLDETFGVRGTPEREKFEERIQRWPIGEAIRQTRRKRRLTQKQLGELMGVREARVSKIKSGKGITCSTMIRAFKAMGAASATLDLGALGRVALW